MSLKMKQTLQDAFSETELNGDIWRIRATGNNDRARPQKDEHGKSFLEVATRVDKYGSVCGAVLNGPAYNSAYRMGFEFQWLGASEKKGEGGILQPKEMKDVLVPLQAGKGKMLVQHWRLRPDRPARGIYYKIWEKAIWSVTCDDEDGLVALVPDGEEWRIPCEKGRWYRLEIDNRPESVKFTLRDTDGKLIGESRPLPHDADLTRGRIWFGVHAEPQDEQVVRYADITLEIEDRVWLGLEQTHLLVDRNGRLMQALDVAINSPDDIENARLVVDTPDEKGLEPEVLSEEEQEWVGQNGVTLRKGWNSRRILIPWPGYDNELSLKVRLVSGSKELAESALRERCFARECTIYVRPTIHCDIAWDKYIEEGMHFYGHDQLERIIGNLEEYPELKFTMEEVFWVYKGLEIEPALKARLEPLIKNGRFCVATTLISEEPDRYDEEALIRNITLGKKWMMKEFGVEPKTYVRLDPPGQIAQYPQIMKYAGVEIASERRVPFVDADPSPLKSAKYFDHLFYRQGIDGSKCLYYWDEEVTAEHLFGIPVSLDPEPVWETFTEKGQVLYNCVKETSDTVFVGTQGHECELMREDIGEKAQQYKRLYKYPDLQFVTLEDVLDIPELQPKNIRTFRRYQPDYFVANGDIGRGPTTDSYTQATRNLVYWETVAAVNEVAGLKDLDREKLDDAWTRFVITMAHGPGVFNVDMADYNDFWRLNERNAVTEIAKEEKEKNLAVFAGGISARRDAGDPLVVFNPLGWKRTGPVELTPNKPLDPGRLLLTDEQGNRVPCQVIKRDDGTSAVLFIAKDTPSMGWRTYYLRSDAGADETAAPVSAGKNVLDTPFYRMEIDSEGRITRIYDKVREREIADMPGARGKDDSDVFSFNQMRMIPDYTDGDNLPTFDLPGEKIKVERIEVEEAGPVRVSLLVKGTIEGYPCHQRIRLYAEVPWLEFVNWIDFREGKQSRRLMTFYPFKFVERMTAYAADLRNKLQFTYWHPFAPAVMDGFDETGPDAQHGWGYRIHAGQMDIAQPEFGYSLATNPFSWAAVRDGVVAASIFSSRLYCGTYQDHINQFVQERNMLVLPHEGSWREEDSWRLRQENNMPLAAAWIAGTKGSMPECSSLLEISADNVLLNSLQSAEDEENTLVIRLVEQEGQAAPTTLRFNRKVLSAHEADILGRPGMALTFRGNEVTVDVGPYRILGVRVRLA